MIAAAGANEIRGVAQEDGRTRAPFHCASDGGKCSPISPRPGRAEQRIGDRVEDDVGVAVPGEPAGMGDGDPAEHHRALAGEGVDVEAEAGARDQPGGEQRLGVRPVGGRGQLFERRIALDRCDAHARRRASTLVSSVGASPDQAA